MSFDLTAVFVIALLALGLLIADRYIRINHVLELEGFLSGSAEGPQRCGVDLAPCPHPKKCMNSFCAGTDSPQMHDRNPLPVVP